MLALGALSGCEYMPGTETREVERAKQAVASLLLDPTSAEYRDAQLRGDWVCGELNGKNRMGAFVGFKRFLVHTDTQDAQIDPEFSYSDLFEAEDLCQSLTGNSYASTSSTVSACDRAAEQRASQLLQARFDKDWAKNCGPLSSKRVYQPPLSEPNLTESNATAVEPGEVSPDLDTAAPRDDEDSEIASDGQPEAQVNEQVDKRWLDEVLARENAANATEPATAEPEAN